MLVNGEPALACLLPLALVAGQSVTTLEGVGSPSQPHPLQQAFYDHFASFANFRIQHRVFPQAAHQYTGPAINETLS